MPLTLRRDLNSGKHHAPIDIWNGLGMAVATEMRRLYDPALTFNAV